MFPEIVIGPILITFGVLMIVRRRKIEDIVHKGLEMTHGDPVADMLSSGKRARVGYAIGGALAIVMGAVEIVLAFIH